MDLRAQISRRLRSDDTDTHPVSFAATQNPILACTADTLPKTVYAQNMLCGADQFTRFINAAWHHEHRHLSYTMDLVVDSSVSVPKRWERLVTKNKPELISKARSLYGTSSDFVKLSNKLDIDDNKIPYFPWLSFDDWLGGSWTHVIRVSL